MSALANRAQRGFTIVETLIAMAVSSFMILTLVSVFASNSQTLRVQNAMIDVNESGRYSLDRMARDLRMLGFRAGGYEIPGKIANSLIVTPGESDALTVVYEAPFDCNRLAAPATGVIQNLFEIEGGNLLCNDQVLVRGIEEMRILLGEDLDGDRVPNRFVPADEASLDFARVVSVKIHLLARSQAERIAIGAAALQLTWNGNIPNDGHLRREYSLTVALRNRI